MTDSSALELPQTLLDIAAQADTPQQLEAAIRAVLTPAQIDAQIMSLRTILAVQEKENGNIDEAFRHFHYCITGIEISPYVEYIWLPQFAAAFRDGKAVMLECHRGAGKSFFMIVWILFLIWWNPIGSTQYIRISGPVAMETDKAIATIIENNPGWKAICPYIVPDDKKGWSSDGRNLWDNRVDYGEWNRLTFADHGTEPSLLCAGILSGSFIGKHPSNGQWYDDLHDEDNTRSALEMQRIVDVIEKNIIPTWTRPGAKPPTMGCACTFWNEKDGYQAFLRTGEFRHVKTPIFVYEEKQQIFVNGEWMDVFWLKDTPIETDLHGRKMRPLWPQGFSVDTIHKLQRQQPVYFPMMYLCDLSAAKGKVLKREWLVEYPHEKIQSNWATYLGIDFASTDDQLKNKDSDFFTIAIWRAIPGGGMVLVGGFRGRLSDHEAVQKAKSIAAAQPNLAQVAVEKFGSGNVFKNNLIYSSNLPVVPYPLEGTPVRSKGQRYANGLAPLFTTGRAWISDVKDEFLNAFIEEWISWNGEKTATGHDDCLDGAYWGAVAGMGHLMTVTPETDENGAFQPGARRSRIRSETQKALSFGDL